MFRHIQHPWLIRTVSVSQQRCTALGSMCSSAHELPPSCSSQASPSSLPFVARSQLVLGLRLMALVASSVLVSVEYMYAPVEGLFRYREVQGSHVRPRGRSERPRGPDLSTFLFLVSPSGLRFLSKRTCVPRGTHTNCQVACPSGLKCRVAPPEHKVACFPDPTQGCLRSKAQGCFPSKAQGCLMSKAQGCLFPLQGTRWLEVKSTRLLVFQTRRKVA